jgi:hypothetical protein
MNKYLPFIIANFVITTPVLADYSVFIPLEPGMFTEAENLTLEGTVTASKTTINLGESFSVSWNYEKLTSIVIPYAGTFSSNSGSVNVSPTKSGPINVVVNNKSKSETETLPITVIIPPVEILSFISTERGIAIGQKINLSWQVDNADYVEFKLLSGSASIPNGKQPNTGTFLSSTGGIVTGDIVSYLLTAYSLDGENIKTATVSVPVRGSMTFDSFAILNPFVDINFGGGIAIPLGGTLNTTWSGTNIKALVLGGGNTSNPNGPVTFSQSMPNPDANSYNIPMNTVGDWNINSIVGTGFNNYQLSKYVNTRVRVYQPTKLSAFTVNGVADEITVTRGYHNFAWASNNPISKFVLSGIYSSASDYSNTTRSASIYMGTVGDYRVRLETQDYNGTSDAKEILVHVKL